MIMSYKDITGEQYEQMLIDLENGTFVPTANEGAPSPLYAPYNSWWDFLDGDDLAKDALSSQYLEFLNNRDAKLHRD